MGNKKYISGKDIISDVTLHDILILWGDRIAHIEDTMVDIRKVMIKLINQSNKIVSFLRELEGDAIETYESEFIPPFFDFNENKINKDIDDAGSVEEIQDILDGLKEKNKELKEFEKELEKHKDELTPGQHGES